MYIFIATKILIFNNQIYHISITILYIFRDEYYTATLWYVGKYSPGSSECSKYMPITAG